MAEHQRVGVAMNEKLPDVGIVDSSQISTTTQNEPNPYRREKKKKAQKEAPSMSRERCSPHVSLHSFIHDESGSGFGFQIDLAYVLTYDTCSEQLNTADQIDG